MQEALNNIAKHSHCNRAAVRLRYLPESVVLEVEDRGVGFPSSHAYGMGLVSMRERAGLVNGLLDLQNLASGGALFRFVDFAQDGRGQAAHVFLEHEVPGSEPHHRNRSLFADAPAHHNHGDVAPAPFQEFERRFHRTFKLDVAPRLGAMHVDDALRRPNPVVLGQAGALHVLAVYHVPVPLDPREVDPPHIVIERRRRHVCELTQGFPWHRNFDGPAAIHVSRIVDCAVNLYCRIGIVLRGIRR